MISHFYNKNGNHLSFDSFSFNFLGGKIMVRNLRYANTDYSVTVNDGYIIFRWWLPHPIGMIKMLSKGGYFKGSPNYRFRFPFVGHRDP